MSRPDADVAAELRQFGCVPARDELERLGALRRQELLTEEEFAAAKRKLLGI